MSTTARPDPWIYVTWITGILSGEKHCELAPWLLSHFRIDKLPRAFDLAAWTAEHTDLVLARARALEADGYTVFLEDQNDFRLKGRSGTLSGKCDLVAIRADDVLVEDVKTGQQKDADFQQVLVYMFALPLLAAAARPSPMAQATVGKTIRGAVQYKTFRQEIQPEAFTAERRDRILETIIRIGAGPRPTALPSARECRYCDIPTSDCAARLDVDDMVAEVEVF
jgi:PD-(D/E)XK nuclease superfamily protein